MHESISQLRQQCRPALLKQTFWVLEFAPTEARYVDPLMGWTSSDETQTQVRLQFETKDAALDYAELKNILCDSTGALKSGH